MVGGGVSICVVMDIYIQVPVGTMKAYQDNSYWFFGAVAAVHPCLHTVHPSFI